MYTRILCFSLLQSSETRERFSSQPADDYTFLKFCLANNYLTEGIRLLLCHFQKQACLKGSGLHLGVWYD